jgi:hypothetical protein
MKNCSMQIYKYLNKIESGERLNFESFKQQLLKQGIDD